MDGINPGTWLPGDSEYMHMFNASWRALKSVSPRLRIGGPAMANLDGVTEFLRAQQYWGIDADFVTTHSYPTDGCNKNATTDPDCYTNGILQAKKLAGATPFLITEYSCGHSALNSLNNVPQRLPKRLASLTDNSSSLCPQITVRYTTVNLIVTPHRLRCGRSRSWRVLKLKRCLGGLFLFFSKRATQK